MDTVDRYMHNRQCIRYSQGQVCFVVVYSQAQFLFDVKPVGEILPTLSLRLEGFCMARGITTRDIITIRQLAQD